MNVSAFVVAAVVDLSAFEVAAVDDVSVFEVAAMVDLSAFEFAAMVHLSAFKVGNAAFVHGVQCLFEFYGLYLNQNLSPRNHHCFIIES